MNRYGNCIKKFQTGIPREIHPDFCSPKIFAKFKGTTQSCWLLLQKYTLNPWWFICAWLNFWVLGLFFFFNSGKHNEWNISEFSNSSVDSPQIFELLCVFWETIMPQRFQLERLLTERSLPRQLQKCTMVLTLRGIRTVQPFFQKGHLTPRDGWT